VEQKISAGVWRIWHVAADVALATGAAEIGPVHFLYGILNFIEQSRANADELPEQDDSHERNRVSSVISEAGVDAVKIRHTLRIHLLQSEHRKQGLSNAAVRMTRSADSRVLFEAGEKAAAGGEMTALHLLAALCRCKDEQVLQALGEDRQKILALLYPAESGERSARTVAEPISDASEGGPKLTVLHQCDASMMIKSPETPTDNSQEFIALCELNWKAGTTGSLDQMFQNLLDGLMKIVTADRGAILVLDRSTGRWMLRTHSGSSTPRISMTSVREAVERKIGFIWKKGVDISMSGLPGLLFVICEIYKRRSADCHGVGTSDRSFYRPSRDAKAADLEYESHGTVAYQLFATSPDAARSTSTTGQAAPWGGACGGDDCLRRYPRLYQISGIHGS
jgi:hypothetical protein